MQQTCTRFGAAPAAIVLLAFLPLLGCTDTACRELSGRWTTREGQSFYFEKNGNALWMIRFGSQVDTITMKYRYDCQKNPAELDLSGFAAGPLVGQSLYGILEWNTDSSFRFDAEAGPGPEVRPRAFESDQTQKFFKEK